MTSTGSSNIYNNITIIADAFTYRRIIINNIMCHFPRLSYFFTI